MAFKNNNYDDIPQNTIHCVLIDGDYGRFELFSNIHPYTWCRQDTSHDIFPFTTFDENASQLMDNSSNIHYHIFYNSCSIELDEYYKILKLKYPRSIWLHPSISTVINTNHDINTLQIQETLSTHECDYTWFIYGIETHYKVLVKQLESNKNLRSNITCYSWLENLKDGSNRIEYLYNYKIKKLIEHQVEELSLESITNKSMTRTGKSIKLRKKQTRQIECDMDGFKKMFENINNLERHELGKHRNIEPDLKGEITITTAETTKKENVKYDIEDSIIQFKNVNALQDYQLVKDTNTQPDSIEETTTTKVKTKKNKSVKCDIEDCNKQFKNTNALKNHQLAKHINTDSVIKEEVPIITTSETKMSKVIKCDFNGCKKSFKKRSKLQKHQMTAHPIAVRCLFSQECISANEKFADILHLSNHIESQHANSFPREICPVQNCKNRKHGYSWSSALHHIQVSHKKHLLHNSFQTSTIKDVPMIDVPCWDTLGPYKCSYKDCSRWYWEEQCLKRHEAFEHPMSLVCPFDSKCQQSKRKYYGLPHLRRHVIKVHAPLFPNPTCFDSECKAAEKKPFGSWPQVVIHILKKHLNAVIIDIELTASSTEITGKISKKCCYDTCDVIFNKRDKFHYHLVKCHPYLLRCPYNSECNKVADNQLYAGLFELEKHIKEEHSVQFSKPMCFDSECQDKKNFSEWNSVINHIVEQHWLDIKSN